MDLSNKPPAPWLSAALIVVAILGVVIVALVAYRQTKKRLASEPSPHPQPRRENKTTTPPGPWPADLPPLEEFARTAYQDSALTATLFIPDLSYNPSSPLASWIGNVIVGLPGEKWPEANGLPMIGVCQLNLSEAPYVPDSLKEFSLITFFVSRDPKDQEYEPPFEPGKWELRAYTPDQTLVPYDNPPPPYKRWKPLPMRPREMQNYFSNLGYMVYTKHPGLSHHWTNKIDEYVEDVLRPEMEEKQSLPSEPEYGTKLGGWPAPIQDDIDIPLAFQIGSEKDANMNWVDAGCIYVWRTEDGQWEVDCQFY